MASLLRKVLTGGTNLRREAACSLPATPRLRAAEGVRRLLARADVPALARARRASGARLLHGLRSAERTGYAEEMTGAGPEPAALLLDLDLDQALPDIEGYDASGVRQPVACVLARERGRPVALLFLDVPETGISSCFLTRALREEAGSVALESGSVRRRGQWGAVGCLDVTVVICTRERPEGLRRALQSLARQTYKSFTVVVVDNAPETEATRQVVEQFRSELSIDYRIEPRRGLSRARNKALAAMRDGIVAWMDDDEEADQAWMAEILSAFIEHPKASAVSGVVVPAELRTKAQLWFEQFGGHSKGRGFSVQIFNDETSAGQSPLFPLPPFGVGANMAFRADQLGVPVPSFCYPHGYSSARVQRAVRDAGYTNACIVGRRIARPTDNVMAVPRLHVRPGVTADAFDLLLRQGEPGTGPQVKRLATPGWRLTRLAARKVLHRKLT